MEINRQKALLFILILVILAAIGGISWNNRDKKETVSESQNKDFYTPLVQSNKDFAQGENFFQAQDYSRAVESYEAALARATSVQDESQIRYKIALALRYGNDPVKAIALFKEVAKNPEYPDRTRAYAVQAMGQAFYSFNDPIVTQEIFKDSPYKEMYDPENIPLSYRKLFEYGSAFYPLGISQLRVADWYAKEILRLHFQPGGAETYAAAIADYKQVIKKKFELADADIMATANRRYEAGANYIPEMTTKKAYILGQVSLTGDESLGNPEEAFDKALVAGAVNNVYDAQAKYHYALFLAQKYGTLRAAEIQNTLKDFYASNRFDNTGMVRFLKNEKNNNTGSKERILLLAEIDPEFKNYLIKLGWQF